MAEYRIHLYHKSIIKTSLGHVDIPGRRLICSQFPLSKNQGFLTLESRTVPLAVILAAASGAQPYIFVDPPTILPSGTGWTTNIVTISPAPITTKWKVKLMISNNMNLLQTIEKEVVGGVSNTAVEFTPKKLIDIGEEIDFDAELFDASGASVAKHSTYKVIGQPCCSFRTPEEQAAINVKKVSLGQRVSNAAPPSTNINNAPSTPVIVAAEVMQTPLVAEVIQPTSPAHDFVVVESPVVTEIPRYPVIPEMTITSPVPAYTAPASTSVPYVPPSTWCVSVSQQLQCSATDVHSVVGYYTNPTVAYLQTHPMPPSWNCLKVIVVAGDQGYGSEGLSLVQLRNTRNDIRMDIGMLRHGQNQMECILFRDLARNGGRGMVDMFVKNIEAGDYLQVLLVSGTDAGCEAIGYSAMMELC